MKEEEINPSLLIDYMLVLKYGKYFVMSSKVLSIYIIITSTQMKFS